MHSAILTDAPQPTSLGSESDNSHETLSPELILVDPELAARTRPVMPGPGETLSRHLRIVRSPVPENAFIVAARSAASRQGRHGLAPLTGGVVSTVFRSRASAMVAGVVAAVVLSLLLPELRAGDSVSTDTAALKSQPTDESTGEQAVGGGDAQTSRATQHTARSRLPESRRFAWAPASHASGYHVELFRGPVKVFTGETATPQITIPARWTRGGRQQSLRPADYRWYVWPIISGQRAARAIVQANLVIPGR